MGTVKFRYLVAPGTGKGADNFNRADGPLGPNWTYFSQGSGVQGQIINNQYAASALEQAEWTTAPTNIRKGYVQCTWVTYTSAAWGGPMCFRNTIGANQNSYFIQAEDLGGGEPRGLLRIFKIRNLATTQIATSGPINLVGFLFAANPLKLTWEVTPTQINFVAFVGNTQVCNGNDAAGDRMTSGKPGITITTSTGLTANGWDGFSFASLTPGNSFPNYGPGVQQYVTGG